MAKKLVSILSEHAIPNYLILKEFEGCYDSILFVTTEKMEKSKVGEHMEEILGLPLSSVERICVENDDYYSSLQVLQDKIGDSSDSYTVNLTGGTKIMSLSVFNFFSKFTAEFIYVPVGKNQYYHYSSKTFKPINYRVNLHEYFALYGIHYESETSFMKPKGLTYDFFERGCLNGRRLNYKIINAQKLPIPEERRYYGGVWFEEFTYHRLKDVYNLRSEDIACSVKIYREGSESNDNEIDVAFVHDNLLYIIECKVTMNGYTDGSKDSETKVVEKFMYKLAAISKDFGLHPRSFILTMHDMSRFSPKSQENFEKRMKILGIGGIVTGIQMSEVGFRLK